MSMEDALFHYRYSSASCRSTKKLQRPVCFCSSVSISIEVYQCQETERALRSNQGPYLLKPHQNRISLVHPNVDEDPTNCNRLEAVWRIRFLPSTTIFISCMIITHVQESKHSRSSHLQFFALIGMTIMYS